MASTYSTSLRLELMATGDQSGTWGTTTNTNLGTLLEQAITGYLAVAQGDVANLTLTATNGASDQARNMIVELTGAMSAGRNVVVPTAEKLYLIKNSTTGSFAVTVKTAAGTGVTVPATTARWVYCDGTNVVDGQSGAWAPSSNDAQALGLSATAWSDLFLASGGVIDFNAGNFTLTHTAGLLTANGTLASSAASAGFVGFRSTSTEAGAAAGPILDLYRNSATPAASDILGQVLFNGEDSAGNTQEYGSIEAVIADATSTSEDGALDFYAMVAGARTRIITVGPNLDLAAIGQIKFPATANPSSDANTLDDYEEGTWTPSDGSGAALSLTVNHATYTKIGRCVVVQCYITYPATADGTASAIAGLPFTVAAGMFPPALIGGTLSTAAIASVRSATTTVFPQKVGGSRYSNAELSTADMLFTATYFV